MRWEQIVRRTGRDESVSDRETRIYLFFVFATFAVGTDVFPEFSHLNYVLYVPSNGRKVSRGEKRRYEYE